MNMFKPTYIATGFLIATLSACSNVKNTDTNPYPPTAKAPQNNLLQHISKQDLDSFQWLNKPEQMHFDSGTLTIRSEPKTDFFIDPENGKASASAPVLYQEVSGDFVATALIEPDLSSTWNAGAMMVIIDDQNWIKFAIENSDATGNSIVTVVTRELSDDANGVRLADKNKVWLKLVRKGDVYSMLWSTDGEKFLMARVAKMPTAPVVKLGLEAQSPLEKNATHKFHHFSIQNQTVANLRTGI